MTWYNPSTWFKKEESYAFKAILGTKEIYNDFNRSLEGEYGAITKAGIKQGLYQRASQFIGEEIEGLGLIRAKKREIEIKKKLAELEREAGLEERVKEERKEATQHLKADVLLIILALFFASLAPSITGAVIGPSAAILNPFTILGSIFLVIGFLLFHLKNKS